ncbi:MAG: RibD family protein [Candidatus Bathyarchaeota archaeon]|nr:RibD family protein [Candidatus Bathyarchaeota archaeon]
MLPKVIVYNTVSVDGAIRGFDVNVSLHYQVLGQFGADALLAGSATAKSGIELFYKTVPPEEIGDLQKPPPQPNDARPLWVIADSHGNLMGLLHVHRKSGYAKDIVVLVSKATPQSYLDYLAHRNYDFIVAGDDHVDYHLALEELSRRYHIATVATDTGGVLAAYLLEAELVDEVQLLVAPEIVGAKATHLFRSLKHRVQLEFAQCRELQGHVLLSFRVKKSGAP